MFGVMVVRCFVRLYLSFCVFGVRWWLRVCCLVLFNVFLCGLMFVATCCLRCVVCCVLCVVRLMCVGCCLWVCCLSCACGDYVGCVLCVDALAFVCRMTLVVVGCVAVC